MVLFNEPGKSNEGVTLSKIIVPYVFIPKSRKDDQSAVFSLTAVGTPIVQVVLEKPTILYKNTGTCSSIQ
jgi:hypothetical protein